VGALGVSAFAPSNDASFTGGQTYVLSEELIVSSAVKSDSSTCTPPDA